jgi:O-acetylserine/cysteine efflux transporter
MTPRDFTITLLVPLLWGINIISLRIGATEFPPVLFTGMRFALLALIVVPFARLPRDKWLGTALVGIVLGIGHFGLLIYGISMTQASLAAILVQLGVPFSSLLAAFVFKDKLGWRRSLGMLVAFIGVGTLFWDPALLVNPFPAVIIIVAAFLWAIANMIIKRMGDVSGMALNGWMAAVASPALLILAFLTEPEAISSFTTATWQGWMSLAYTVLASSLVAYGVWYWALRKFDINQVVPLTLIAPVISVLLAYALLDEPLTLPRLGGGLLVILGVAVVVIRRPSYIQRSTES